MQLSPTHAFWDITPQNWLGGLTPSCAKKRTKKSQTITISPLRGGHSPEPINMPFRVLSGVPDVITHAKLYINRLRRFSEAAPRKVPFLILFRTTLTTLLHYCADCERVKIETANVASGLTRRSTLRKCFFHICCFRSMALTSVKLSAVLSI